MPIVSDRLLRIAQYSQATEVASSAELLLYNTPVDFVCILFVQMLVSYDCMTVYTHTGRQLVYLHEFQ